MCGLLVQIHDKVLYELKSLVTHCIYLPMCSLCSMTMVLLLCPAYSIATSEMHKLFVIAVICVALSQLAWIELLYDLNHTTPISGLFMCSATLLSPFLLLLCFASLVCDFSHVNFIITCLWLKFYVFHYFSWLGSACCRIIDIMPLPLVAYSCVQPPC